MKTVQTTGIVLARINFQEADRIVTLLTPDQGKVRVVAKGVRKSKSKLAGGIELFSVCDITYLPGRGELGTLVSTRLKTHYGNIVGDINRTLFGYDLLKRINKLTEDVTEEAYFDLARVSLKGLDTSDVPLETIELWMTMQLLKLGGHMPNLRTDTAGNKLRENETYDFSFDDMAFAAVPRGSADNKLVKVLRLSASAASPQSLAKVQGADTYIAQALKLLKSMGKLYLWA